MTTWFRDNSLSIGNTPLVKLNRITDGAGATVLAQVVAAAGVPPAAGTLGLGLVSPGGTPVSVDGMGSPAEGTS